MKVGDKVVVDYNVFNAFSRLAGKVGTIKHITTIGPYHYSVNFPPVSYNYNFRECELRAATTLEQLEYALLGKI